MGAPRTYTIEMKSHHMNGSKGVESQCESNHNVTRVFS
jgi:hypothetical protein